MSAVTTAMTAILKQFQATPPPASMKAIEEICVTCGGAHPYYQCLAAGGNTFPELRGLGSLPSNTVANPKGELKAITTQSGFVLDGPTVPTPPPFINPEEDKRVEETLTDPNLSEYTIKVPPPPIQKYKPPKLKCKALADLGASINLMTLSVWKKLGLPELIFTRMTLELANRAICTPARIARDVFDPIGKFTFPADFIIVGYESDPRVPLILERPFLRSTRALIDIHGEEMILRDGDERLTLNMRHDPSSYSNQPQKESINLINVFNNSSEDFLEDLFSNQPSGNPTFHPELTLPEVKDDIFDLEGGTMFTDEHALDYSSPSIFDECDDDFFEIESDAENVYDDLFDSKGEKIKKSKLLIDELDLPCDFLPLSDQEKPFEIITRVVQDKKVATSNASLVLEDFDPPLYEPFFFKEVPRNLKTHAEGFCPQVLISSASLGNHVSKSNRANVYLMAYLINDHRFT
uniref:Reverse transcriptase domain-containing protein n=1 Tax=Tanacetum cinerariifolium TaxID=118510 RepID=A0A6L2JYG7_TANCI|nr:reverse transcriptase domain-containing protein [Tanacetum cinerariifolium]